MTSAAAETWRGSFWQTIQESAHAEPLREATLSENLGNWTAHLTTATVQVCRRLGWEAAAKGHRLERLPEARCEYLSLDVMAFDPATARWHYPVAVFELENSKREDRIAYSLWKVLCTRAALRVVFCYRRNPEDAGGLVKYLASEVVASLSNQERLHIEGETVVVVGSRDESGTFPFGFFKWWALEKNTGSFRPL